MVETISINNLIKVTERIVGGGDVGDIWVFKIDTFTNRDGAYFDLGPSQRTNVVEVRETCIVQEKVEKGDAWLLTMPSVDSHVRDIKYRHVFAGDSPIDCSTGVSVWIAGKHGAVIENITEPPYQPSMERVIEEGETGISQTFWDLVNALGSRFRIK